MPDAALTDLNVLDLTHYIAGPFATKLLADFGANVIKVERPGSGDPARRLGPFVHDEPHPEKSIPYLYLNTNKRGVTLNLKTSKGVQLFKELVLWADVLVENFAPRVMSSLSLSYETLEQINPRLVMVSVSNFGQTGPYRDYKSSELVAYALSGIAYISGDTDRQPIKHGLSQAQYAAGVNGAYTSLIGFFVQQATGQGQHIDVSIAECLTSTLVQAPAYYSYMGAIQWRRPAQGGALQGGNALKCKDGYVVLARTTHAWDGFADFLGEPALKHPKFATERDRLQHAAELDALVEHALERRAKVEIFHSAHEQRLVLAGVVQDPKDLRHCPQLASRGYFRTIDHPIIEEATHPGPSFTMTETPWAIHRPAPLLGQHNYEVYSGMLGYSPSDLMLLRQDGVM